MKVYDNRELSWLKFNKRVLEEARDRAVPLMERLLFVSIFENNLDEFFMVRVGSLHDSMLIDDSDRENKTRLKPSEQLERIFKKVQELNILKDETFADLTAELKAARIEHLKIKELTKDDAEFLKAYYNYEIKPFISPQIVDKRHPFPFLKNKELYVLAKLSSKNNVTLGIIPATAARVVFLPEKDGAVRYLLAEEIILHFAANAFAEYKTEEKALIRVTRNADINVEEGLFDYELDFRAVMSELIRKRKRLCPVRLQVSKELSDLLFGEICTRLELTPAQVYFSHAPLDLSFVPAVFEKTARRTELFFGRLVPQNSPAVNEKRSMIEQADETDILLSYPYESIKPFIRLLQEAAVSPEVVSVKITLYRVARDSKVIQALIDAAENGKEVLVLVELRARFDEENNIGWSKRLEDAGCAVIYGPESLKVHSKLLLITRRIGEDVKYTVQIGTGNYNEKTAQQYTDLCLITSHPGIAADAAEVFGALSTGALVETASHLLVAPRLLQSRLLELLDTEIAKAKNGEPAYAGFKLNSLTDKVIIDKLIECSRAGVRIELVVRGISCLIAGVPGVTDNIKIVSIVGRFLEHARIYFFGANEATRKVYLSSADLMTRNTVRRIEVAAPVYDDKIRTRLIQLFKLELSDNVKARVQQPDGSYVKKEAAQPHINAQEALYHQAYEAARLAAAPPPKQEPAPQQAVKAKKKSLLSRILGIFKKKKQV
ncbi:MAG: polyphosphate kinase 1 [Oscillospiraceae bacterium]